MILKIQIRRKEGGNLCAIVERDGKPRETLFQFDYRNYLDVPAWLFWTNGQRFPMKFPGARKDFPMQYFRDACRARYFLYLGSTEIPDDIVITYGHGHIGMKK